MHLTPQGSQIVEEIARRYCLSVDAVLTMLQAVVNGGGTMAQFSHPEFGGSGQWMQGGMTMVGDMFNNNLKAKVDNLCYELSGLVATQPLFEQPAQGQGGPGAASLFVGHSGVQWWPAELGSPSSSGSQDNLRYAVFPGARRLAIEIDGQLTVYDTLDHQIGGVGQQQGQGASFAFTSQYGVVSVSSLPVVSGRGHGVAPPGPQPSGFDAPAYPAPDAAADDVFAKIERLAELRQRGILSDGEFAAKKAELLGRI